MNDAADITALALALGLTGVVCPQCDRADAITTRRGDRRAYCHRCPSVVGPCDLVVHVRGGSWRDAATVVEELAPGLCAAAGIELDAAPPTEASRRSDTARELVVRGVAEDVGRDAIRYLHARGLVADLDGAVSYRWIPSGGSVPRDADERTTSLALASGCWRRADDGRLWWALGERRLLIVHRDTTGRVRGLRSRHVDPPALTDDERAEIDLHLDGLEDGEPEASTEENRYLAPTSDASRVWCAHGPGALIVVEGSLDFAAVAQLGARVACTHGAAAGAEVVAELASHVRRGDPVVLIPDVDTAGARWTSRVAAGLARAGAVVSVATLPDGSHDPADLAAIDARPDRAPDLVAQQWRLVSVLAGARPLWTTLVEQVRGRLDDPELVPEIKESAILDVLVGDADRQPARWAELVDALGLTATSRHPVASRLRAMLSEAGRPARGDRKTQQHDVVERSRDGSLVESYANLVAWLSINHPGLAHDDMRVAVHDGDRDVDDEWFGDLRCALEKSEGAEFGLEKLEQASRHVALRHRHHPVREWLGTLRWDGDDRISHLVDALSVTEGQRDLATLLVTRWLIAAVRRVRQPGVEAHGVLVLQGAQGVGKSRGIKALAGRDWYHGTRISPKLDKDALLQLGHGWIVELAEVDQMMWGAESGAIKQIISDAVDTYRAPYARAVERHPRSTVCAGTSNRLDLLRDQTGDRRWWVLAVEGLIDVERIEVMREQIWAQAAAMEAAGERHWLDPAEERLLASSNDEYRASDPLSEAVADAVERMQVDEIECALFLEKIFDDSRATPSQASQVREAMSRLGWQRVRPKPPKGSSPTTRRPYVFRRGPSAAPREDLDLNNDTAANVVPIRPTEQASILDTLMEDA